MRYLLLTFSVLTVFSVCSPRADTQSQSSRAQRMASLIWQSKFDRALDSCQKLVTEEPQNPLGYCLLGMLYHSIQAQYRTDRYDDLIDRNLDSAIALAGAKSESNDRQSENLFLLGSALGYRALERSVHGSWFQALKDGHRSCTSLEKAVKLDTTLTDAFLGVGDYHYWKSAKSKFFSWLPFISDNRKKGLEEIRRAIRSGSVGSLSARKSLLPIYLNERQYAEVIALVDSLSSEGASDPSCLLNKIKAEVELGNWVDAEKTLDELQGEWNSSPFVDRCGACEVQLQKAKILLGRGDEKAARTCIQEILAMKGSCETNEYFRETVSVASGLHH